MSNYRRLISYIYAYEGGVKGKNIGFAKIETRGIQCKITVSAKRIYVGGNDIGVYLLAGEQEVYLGNIFIRGGSGEFRTAVSASDIEHSGICMDQCYGLTIHDVKNTWRSYTTIWEDAVAHAAELELENTASASKEKDQATISEEQIKRAVREIEEEFPLEPDELQNSIQKTVLEEEEEVETEASSGDLAADEENLVQIEQEQSEVENLQTDTIHTETEEAGDIDRDSAVPDGLEQQETQPSSTEPIPDWQQDTRPPITGSTPWWWQGTRPPSTGPMPEGQQGAQPTTTGPMPEGQQGVQPTTTGPMPEGQQGTQPTTTGPMPEGQQGTQPTMTGPMPGVPQVTQPAATGPLSEDQQNAGQEDGLNGSQVNETESVNAEAADTGEKEFTFGEPYVPHSNQDAMGNTIYYRADAAKKEGRNKNEVQPKLGNPAELERLRKNEDHDENSHDLVWQKLKREHTRMLAFDYEDGCEILTIKPQDIGLLPRDSWVYGNNSFLLHGYYNYRYLIVAKLLNPNGAPRYLLGIPGHYYSNERYMASMFGFPNFVLSKEQPMEDGRFGFWYTDVKLGG